MFMKMQRGGTTAVNVPYARMPKSIARVNYALMQGEISQVDAMRDMVEYSRDWHRFRKIFLNRLVRVDHCFIDDTSSLVGMRATGYLGEVTLRQLDMQPSFHVKTAHNGLALAVEMFEKPDSHDPAFYVASSLPPYVRHESPDPIPATFYAVE